MPNFELFLFIAVVVCGVTMFICRFVFPNLAQRQPEPWYLDYARSFFPVLLIVFLLRGFVAEPFRIPSASMLPTLEIGDFILVNKFTYGVRLPITYKKVMEVNAPQRGDIVVFRWPKDNKTSFIKRLIGLPGDTVVYRHNSLTVNGQKIGQVLEEDYLPFGKTRSKDKFAQTIETGAVENDANTLKQFSILHEKDAMRRGREGSWVIPEGHYFMMGDNRDNSADSRAWGLVPEQNIVGKAFFVWFHYNTQPGGGFKFSRVGTEIEAQELAPQ